MTMRAGAARVSLEPPLGLPMVGFVRQWQTADGYGWPLEATALVVEAGDARVALVGVDTVGIQSPEVDVLRERVGAAIGAPILEGADVGDLGVLLCVGRAHQLEL